MLIAGEGRAPTTEHLLRLAKEVGLRRARAIVDEVRTAVTHFKQVAREAEVPSSLVRRVAAVLDRCLAG